MRITTRVAIGLFLMAILLIVSLTYQLSQVERLQRVNREVSLINVEGARISLRLLQGLDGVQEFAAKYQILPGDPDYLAEWRQWERAVDADLDLLAEVGLSDREEVVRSRIEEGWRRYRNVSSPLETEPVTVLPRVVFPQIQSILEGLRVDVGELIQTQNEIVTAQAEESAVATSRARVVAWISAGSALALAALLSLLLYRSISTPLRRLTRGTREIARGRFEHRLRIRGPRELSSLAKDFDRMAARLDELENLKRDFVSHVSHELKTPLAAVQETIEVLLDELPGPLTEKQARLLEHSRSSSGRLSSMISDLLETSRLEAGAAGYVPGWHDVANIVRSVLDEMEPLAVERDLEVLLRVATLDGELVCDRNRLREVVANLVSNAIKFSPKGGKVRLVLNKADAPPDGCPGSRARVRAEKGPFLLLSIEDEGPGVPDRDKEGIFEKFHQVRKGERLRGQGVGLGLAISWRVVGAHGGAIWVEDRPRGGSVFKVLLAKIPSHWSGDVQPASPLRVAEADPAERMMIPVASSGRPAVRATRGVALGVLIASTSFGCATVEPPLTATTPPPLPDPVEEPIGRAAVAPPAELVVPEAAVRLRTGWSLFASGDYADAYTQFLGVMREDTEEESTGQAVWAMALLHLAPDSPHFDPDWAHALLDYLRLEYPMRGAGLQATWAQGLLAELANASGRLEEQDAALRRLQETVDQLREIDVNRAPSGVPGQLPPNPPGSVPG